MLPRRQFGWLMGLSLVGLYGCTNTPTEDRSAATPKPSTRPPGRTTPPGTPSATPTSSATPSPTKAPHPVSLPALMAKTYDGRGLKLGRVLDRNSAYTRYYATYLSGDLTISGIVNVPAGRGPFPALVLNHGHIDPEIYTNGRGLKREQDYLARRGYVVLHTDYRNHAQSDDDPDNELHLRIGYTEDAINAVLALRESSLPYLGHDRIGMLGRSMGGGVTYNALVAQPGLVKAGVVFAPVSSNAAQNFNRWSRGDDVAPRIIAAYGAPERNSEFWRGLSAVNYFDRVTEPIVIHHGTSDDTCPPQWSRDTQAALKRAGKDSTLYWYEGEEHAFVPQWPASMRRTVQFLDRHLKG
jgi:dipeptidyl aminopeptidase/acylaminoacyl peptidase